MVASAAVDSTVSGNRLTDLWHGQLEAMHHVLEDAIVEILSVEEVWIRHQLQRLLRAAGDPWVAVGIFQSDSVLRVGVKESSEKVAAVCREVKCTLVMPDILMFCVHNWLTQRCHAGTFLFFFCAYSQLSQCGLCSGL